MRKSSVLIEVSLGFQVLPSTSFLNRSDSNFLFKVDAPRGFFSGILEAGFGIFVLIIAIRFFNAPNYCKAILAGGSAFGLILSPLIMSFWSGSRYSSSNKCGVLMLVTSTFIFLASLCKEVHLLTFYLLLAQISLSQVPNLMIKIYSDLYSSKERGFRLSCNLVLSTIGAMLVAWFLGKYLDMDDCDYRLAFWTMSLASAFCSLAHFFMPDKKNESQDENSRMQRIRDIIRIPVEDRLFFRVLTAWMILGFGVIMTFPLRIEFLADKKGLNFSNEEIALVGVSVFFVFKVIGAVLFGKLFDRINFMRFRIFLNLFLLIAILVYFNSETFLGVAIGTGLAGLAGGANIAWNLWVH